ncbi:creatininase family protein, partial [Mesorhizobium japonicum]|uniref:creatininase family protein n=1 Tax=Mesorhizobium japonicum TaxID=2066070 RepID=UPI003B5BA709
MRSAEVAAAADAGGVALLPVGATEQHGQHLPITTDALIAEALAVACAASMERPAWVLPTLSYGRSIEHAGYAGTVSLSARTLLAVVDD